MKNTGTNKLLVIGIGNSGRRDDGLGWAFLDHLSSLEEFEGDLEYRYQLQVEDAEMISKFEKVVFVDATKDLWPDGFSINRLVKKKSESFTTHAVAPSHILYLCGDLYDIEPESYMLAISGHEWGLKLGLSEKANNNLTKAISHLTDSFILSSPTFG